MTAIRKGFRDRTANCLAPLEETGFLTSAGPDAGLVIGKLEVMGAIGSPWNYFRVARDSLRIHTEKRIRRVAWP